MESLLLLGAASSFWMIFAPRHCAEFWVKRVDALMHNHTAAVGFGLFKLLTCLWLYAELRRLDKIRERPVS